jgi:hypothetical protein
MSGQRIGKIEYLIMIRFSHWTAYVADHFFLFDSITRTPMMPRIPKITEQKTPAI